MKVRCHHCKKLKPKTELHPIFANRGALYVHYMWAHPGIRPAGQMVLNLKD